jgi:hypothetical protein
MKDGNDKTIALGVVTGVTLLIGGGETAQAAVLTQTDTFTITDNATSSDSNTKPLTFNLFDPSQGMLTSIEFVLTSDTTTSVSFTAKSNSELVGSGMATNSTTFTVGVPTPFMANGSASASCLGAPGQLGMCSAQNTSGPSPFNGTETLTSGLSVFEGTGTFTETLSYSNHPTCVATSGPLGTCTIDTGTGLTWDGNRTTSTMGSLEVQYTYTPVPVPAPALSGLPVVGAGLFWAGAGIFRRRRRQPAETS